MALRFAVTIVLGLSAAAPPFAAHAQEATKASANPAAAAKAPAVRNPAPTAKDWADIAKLPDWSGIWNPNITDQDKQIISNMPPWKPEIAAKIEHMRAEEKAAGRLRSWSVACRRACRRGC